MTCKTARKAPPTPMRGARMAYVRHALPGDPIELVVVIDGEPYVVAVSDRVAADTIVALARALSSNMTAAMRRSQIAMPRAGSRT